MTNYPALFKSNERKVWNKARSFAKIFYQSCFVFPAKSKNIELMNGSIILLFFGLNRDHPMNPSESTITQVINRDVSRETSQNPSQPPFGKRLCHNGGNALFVILNPSPVILSPFASLRVNSAKNLTQGVILNAVKDLMSSFA